MAKLIRYVDAPTQSASIVTAAAQEKDDILAQGLNGNPVIVLENTEIGETSGALVNYRAVVPKTAGTAWAALDSIQWDDTAKEFIKWAAGAKHGYAARAALSADTEGEVVVLFA